MKQLLKNCTLIDGLGGTPVSNAQVLVFDDRIERVETGAVGNSHPIPKSSISRVASCYPVSARRMYTLVISGRLPNHPMSLLRNGRFGQVVTLWMR